MSRYIEKRPPRYVSHSPGSGTCPPDRCTQWLRYFLASACIVSFGIGFVQGSVRIGSARLFDGVFLSVA
jgi:hypothetical protein